MTIPGKYLGSVKIGAKGQIVIPKEVRDMFDVKPGDMLVLLADADRGIALQRYEMADQITRSIFEGVTAVKGTGEA